MSDAVALQTASSQFDASLSGPEAGGSRAGGRLTVSQQRELMSQKAGDRRTIYWTKVSKGGAYQTTGTYLGQWHANKKHGKGTQTWANGDKYVGEWVEGKPAGFGTFWKRMPNKQKLVKQYAGQWLNGQQHGRGVHYYPDGSVYDGHWRNGLRSGVGIMSYADGSVYEGSFFNDKRHGFGVIDHVNGDHFEGHYVEDKREGEVRRAGLAPSARRVGATWPAPRARAPRASTRRPHPPRCGARPVAARAPPAGCRASSSSSRRRRRRTTSAWTASGSTTCAKPPSSPRWSRTRTCPPRSGRSRCPSWGSPTRTAWPRRSCDGSGSSAHTTARIGSPWTRSSRRRCAARLADREQSSPHRASTARAHRRR